MYDIFASVFFHHKNPPDLLIMTYSSFVPNIKFDFTEIAEGFGHSGLTQVNGSKFCIACWRMAKFKVLFNLGPI
jgi:hypothetical protein